MNFVGDLMICPEQGNDDFFFKLDSTTIPKQITLTYKSGNVEREVVGIYELDGDRLKICLPKFPKYEKAAIPKDFTASKGSGRNMFILKRVKSKVEERHLPRIRVGLAVTRQN